MAARRGEPLGFDSGSTRSATARPAKRGHAPGKAAICDHLRQQKWTWRPMAIDTQRPESKRAVEPGSYDVVTTPIGKGASMSGGDTGPKIYFSDVFGLQPAVLEDYGAFNIALINDLPLFVDPFLLYNSQNDTYRSLHENIITYLCFLRDRAVAGELTPGPSNSGCTSRRSSRTGLASARPETKGPASARSLPGRSLKACRRSSRTSEPRPYRMAATSKSSACLVAGSVERPLVV